MDRIEVNAGTGEVKVVPVPQAEADAAMAAETVAQPLRDAQPRPVPLDAVVKALVDAGVVTDKQLQDAAKSLRESK